MEPRLTLSQLLVDMAEAPPVPVGGITTDSRAVERGEVFLALKGETRHGLSFLDEVIAAGAIAVAWDGDASVPRPGRRRVPIIEVPELGNRLGEIANRFFDEPSRQMTVAGVTGTNGKTTVAWLLAQCLRQAGLPCGYVGTLGAGLDENDLRAGLTTPACIDLHGRLAGFRAAGADRAVLEVSSHGLRQGRVDGVHFDSAVFTNLSRDHIDYHGDMQRYGETKASFVLREDIPRHIINIDDPFGLTLVERSRREGGVEPLAVSTVASKTDDFESYVRLAIVARDDAGTSVDAHTAWGDAAFHLPLVGRFNVANAALVLAQLLSWAMPLADAVAALRRTAPPPGRLQRVVADAAPEQPAVYVDYAHTPAGLEAVLHALRPHCAGRLWCVFGCGGDRDQGKRPMMGRVAAQLADRVVLTNDNPRSEVPQSIIDQILAGMPTPSEVIEDRAAAIAYAIESADDDDIILVAGKGHEQYQQTGDLRRPFSDYAIAFANLSARQVRGAGAK
jgi:UDP-N-acetylmuramoyl-L-alanyl-D-glutamate--2,6-diaminopimelate ligase